MVEDKEMAEDMEVETDMKYEYHERQSKLIFYNIFVHK